MAAPSDAAKPPSTHSGPLPWVRMRSAPAGPQAFKRMVGDVDPKAKAGDIVAVYDKSDAPYGTAFFNPKSLITLRMLSKEGAGFDADAFFAERVRRAVLFRREALGLDKTTDAYRLVHDLGDGLPGLVADRYNDHIVLELYSLGMFRQVKRLEKVFAGHFPGARFVHRASRHTETMEGFRIADPEPCRTRIRENGILFEVEPSAGYKTGFFCDQRENRLAVAGLAAGRKVLDVCSYTGGFGLYAKKGGASEVACVELDEEASARARRNANINSLRVDTVCADAFPYLRQMAANGARYGLIVLDPYKIIGSREGYALGRQKYIDLNKLAFGVLEEGGILVTCSCSGMLPMEEFQQIVRTAAGVTGRRAQVFRKSGAGPDHPFAADHPEGEYLKVLWCKAG